MEMHLSSMPQSKLDGVFSTQRQTGTLYVSTVLNLQSLVEIESAQDHGKTLTDGSWEFDYAIDPFTNSTLPETTLRAAVLGGESCMWSPHFDSANFMTEAFPRAAAVAERLWSEQSVTDVDYARTRLHEWRCRLLRRGLATGPINGGQPVGGSGTAGPFPPTHFGGFCASGPWEPSYTPPFAL